ncbi:MAG: hypothetical protein RBR52_06565 [Thiomonas sp.]|uniref:hypothetical protein n=1 Tax=Thiomonas sp. TaxID=2047785 RepID=UPI002A36BEEC|nr:hypothetical protein [Thiomonas sp.]MDY0330140.1 hypothetical protein [Thiomonas sp.]
MLSTARYPPAASAIRFSALLLTAAALLCACSPAFDWRDVHPKDINIVLTYPCKPEQIAQDVVLADQKIKMSMTGCVADRMTFALAHARLPSPALAARALAQLHQAAVENVHGRITFSSPDIPKNATPGLADSLDLRIDGQAPDGKPVRERVLLFSQGSDVYQLTAFAPTADFKDEAAQTFAGSVNLSPSP